MKAKHRKLEHYLVTIALGNFAHMHGYVMCSRTNRDGIERVMNRMFDEAEQRRLDALPIVLKTTLSDGVDTVRKIAGRNPEAARMMEEADDFHFTAFATPLGSPDDVTLMALH